MGFGKEGQCKIPRRNANSGVRAKIQESEKELAKGARAKIAKVAIG